MPCGKCFIGQNFVFPPDEINQLVDVDLDLVKHKSTVFHK